MLTLLNDSRVKRMGAPNYQASEGHYLTVRKLQIQP